MKKPSDQDIDHHEQSGQASDVGQAGLVLLGIVLTAIIVITVIVDNSQAPWETKFSCVAVALTSFVILAGWLD